MWRVCPSLSLAAAEGGQATSSTAPSLLWVLRRDCSEGCCLLACMLQPWHSGQSWALRIQRVRGIGWMTWWVSEALVRPLVSTGRGHRALICLGSRAGTCRDRDGAISHVPYTLAPPQQLLPHTHHSPRAATASFRTSLFLSSKGLASARITRPLYGSSCRTEGALCERTGCWLPPRRFGTPLPLYIQAQAAGCCRSTYHCCGQTGERMGTAQGSDADSLEQTGMRAAQGAGEGRSREEGEGARTMVGLEVRLRNLVTSVSTCRLMIWGASSSSGWRQLSVESCTTRSEQDKASSRRESSCREKENTRVMSNPKLCTLQCHSSPCLPPRLALTVGSSVTSTGLGRWLSTWDRPFR